MDTSHLPLFEKIDKENVPKHIAIIMDGNGRWATEKGLSRVVGHKEGISSIYRVSRLCSALNVKTLSLYAFSTENWKRPKLEVKSIMELFRTFMPNKIDDFNANNVKVTVMGRLWKLSPLVRKAISITVAATKNNTGLNLNFAINYGGREEIVDGVVSAIKKGLIEKELTIEEFNSLLYYKDLPDVDLLIRTAGDCRVSNFMLWHIPYTEMFFTDVLWPDFKEKDLCEAVLDYQKRTRRFGGI